MKPLTTSVYTFSNLIEGRFLYVDKTAGIHDLLRPAFGQYFLSRPRRFGKSLLVSTLKAIFQGRRELFSGLYLAGADYDWKTYPVIHLDLGTAAAQTAAELEQMLGYAVDDSARELAVGLTREGPAAYCSGNGVCLRPRSPPVFVVSTSPLRNPVLRDECSGVSRRP
jgi:hypothetical protein